MYFPVDKCRKEWICRELTHLPQNQPVFTHSFGSLGRTASSSIICTLRKEGGSGFAQHRNLRASRGAWHMASFESASFG